MSNIIHSTETVWNYDKELVYRHTTRTVLNPPGESYCWTLQSFDGHILACGYELGHLDLPNREALIKIAQTAFEVYG